MNDTMNFDGLWRIAYWYPSNEHTADDISEYQAHAIVSGKDVVFESLPNEEKSYILVRLTLEDGIAIGNWHETTSPTGSFKGAMYNGVGQLVVSPDGTNLEGKWVGGGFDHKLGQMRIYTGNWEITKLSE